MKRDIGVNDVIQMMRRSGTFGQEAEERRNEARRYLQGVGISNYIDNGPPQRYHFAFDTPLEVRVQSGGATVPCLICAEERSLNILVLCGACRGSGKVIPSATIKATGFILDPAQDWTLVGYMTAS